MDFAITLKTSAPDTQGVAVKSCCKEAYDFRAVILQMAFLDYNWSVIFHLMFGRIEKRK